MTATALKTRPLPEYTRIEEALNCISHALGVIMGTLVLIRCIGASTNAVSLAGSIVYGASIILLYLVSSTYHGINKQYLLAKQIMRVVDHCTINVLIAGCYTPVLLNVIYNKSPRQALILLAFVWIFATVGIVLTAIDMQKYSKLSMACYIILGWFALFIIKPIYTAAGPVGLALLLGGGISYTVGAVIYGCTKRKYTHLVFHMLVLLGTYLQYLCILNYIIK